MIAIIVALLMKHGKYAGQATICFKQITEKIHMQRRGKMGSGARPVPEEAVPEGRRDVTGRATAGEICPYCGSKQGAKELPRRSLLRENDRYRKLGRAGSWFPVLMTATGATLHIVPFR